MAQRAGAWGDGQRKAAMRDDPPWAQPDNAMRSCTWWTTLRCPAPQPAGGKAGWYCHNSPALTRVAGAVARGMGRQRHAQAIWPWWGSSRRAHVRVVAARGQRRSGKGTCGRVRLARSATRPVIHRARPVPGAGRPPLTLQGIARPAPQQAARGKAASSLRTPWAGGSEQGARRATSCAATTTQQGYTRVGRSTEA